MNSFVIKNRLILLTSKSKIVQLKIDTGFLRASSFSSSSKQIKSIRSFRSYLFKDSKSILNQTRLFSLSPVTKAVPPIIWFFLKPASKIFTILVGREIRLKYGKKVISLHFKTHLLKYVIGMCFIIGSLITYYKAHIYETPITHRKRFLIFSSQHLSHIEKMQMDDNIKYQRAISEKLFNANKELNGVSDIKWNLTVIESDIINASAFPNGSVIVYTGLLDFIKNDHELAIILAHEMAHAEKMSQAQFLDYITILLLGLIWLVFPTDSIAYFFHNVLDQVIELTLELPYSRQLESEADYVGSILAARACFDIRYSSVFWKRMHENGLKKIKETNNDNKNPKEDSDKSESDFSELASTHPSSENRAEQLNKIMPEMLKIRKDCRCYDLPNNIDFENLIKEQKISMNKKI